ncbi:MAG: ankyrin repeat domain-containing protein [Planctomycetota bacterium]
MAAAEDELLTALELHSVARLRAVLDAGFDANAPVRGKPPIDWLVEMYTRSDRFPECVALLLARGAKLADPRVTAVLLDDATAVAAAVRADTSLLHHRTTLVSAFTPLTGATLLHVAAEFGHVRCAEQLLQLGADVNARAAIDEHGLGGHTALFHTVNSNANRSAPVMRLLLDAGAEPDVPVRGLCWGKGFDWETTLFDVTPISYAQCGLLPQMHRDERQVYENVRLLLAAAGRALPPLGNVPNRYLQPKPK